MLPAERWGLWVTTAAGDLLAAVGAWLAAVGARLAADEAGVAARGAWVAVASPCWMATTRAGEGWSEEGITSATAVVNVRTGRA